MSHSPLKIVKASAGSGKTFTLTLQYLTLIFASPHHFQKILAVTFTNKATDEMKQRILSVLKMLAEPENIHTSDPYKTQLLDLLPHETPSSLQVKADVLYRQIIHTYHKFSVSTIDAFIQKVIRSFAFELGLDSQFALEMNIKKVNEDLIKALDIQLPDKPELMNFLYSYVLNQIKQGKNWNYKTKLEEFTQELFKENYAQFEDLLLQFDSTEKFHQTLDELTQIADRCIDEFEKGLKETSQQAAILFDQFAIETDMLAGKSKSPLLLLNSLDVNTNFGRILTLLDPETKWFQKKVDFPELQSEIIALILSLKKLILSYYKNYVLSLNVRNHFNYISFMQELSLLLRDYRKDAHKLLITDATKLLSGIIGEDSNPAFIWEKTGQQYQYFLFDEFQDTSNSQWRSFIPLLDNVLSESPQKVESPHHLIVGDVKQAIYRWRNGNWNILHQYAEQQFAYHSQVESLVDNRRSCKNIINFNNHLYLHLPRILQTDLNKIADSSNDEIRIWWRKNKFDTIIEQVYKDAEQQFPEDANTQKQGGTVKFSIYEKKLALDENEEDNMNALDLLVDKITQLKEERNYALSDIAVLVRTHSQASKVVNALLARQIPVISGDALKLVQNDALTLIINLLKGMFYAPKHQNLFWAEAAWLYAKLWNKEFPPQAWLDFHTTSIKNAYHIFPKLFCDQFEAWQNMPSSALLEQIIHAFELDNLPEHQLYLLRLRDLMAQYNAFGDKGILSFLDWWQKEGIEKNLPEMSHVEAVQVLTIHKSKGLDFKAVFVPYCDWSVANSRSTFMADMSKTPFRIFKYMPMQTVKALMDTEVAPSYLQEVMYQYMDAINMLYVATTRSVDYLHLMVGAKKDYGTFSNVGHAIVQLLQKFPLNEQNYWQSETEFSLDEPKIQKTRLQTQEKHTQIPTYRKTQFEKYFNTRISIAAKRSAITEDYSREGTIMHEILAQCHQTDEVEKCIQKLKSIFEITAEETSLFVTQTLSILQNPALEELFRQGEVLSEQSILCADGKTIRPDKIIIKPDETVIVVDYKFTQDEKKAHQQQVKNYQLQLLSMGYKEVTSYLYYFKTNHLEALHL